MHMGYVRGVIIMKLLLVPVLVLYFHLGEGQSTSEWRELICHIPNDAVRGDLFAVKMDECSIIIKGDCSDRLISSGFLETICSLLNDGTYTCRISNNYTGRACCYSKVGGTFSCLPSIVRPTPTPTSTPSSTKLSDTSTTVTVSIGATPTPSPETEDMANGSNSVTSIVVGVVVLVIFFIVLAAVGGFVLWYVKCRRRTPGYSHQDRDQDRHQDRHQDSDQDRHQDRHQDSDQDRHQDRHQEDAEANLDELDSVRNKVKGKGGYKPKVQKNSQLVQQPVLVVPVQATVRNRFKRKGFQTVEMRRRPLQNVQEETKIEDDSEWLSTRTAVPFSHSLGTSCTSQSVVQHFSDIFEPPTVDTIILGPRQATQEYTSSRTAQASDDGNSPYVPMLPKSSSLVRELNDKDLVAAYMSQLQCKDGTRKKPSITSVVQGHMKSLVQDGQEAEVLVVQQKVKEGENISSVVAHKQQGCFKSDDQTRSSSVSGKDPLKNHKFPPSLFGAVVVAMTCILTLATCVLPGSNNPSTVLCPSWAVKCRWLDRGTPWIRALADPSIYHRVSGPPILPPAVYRGIFMLTVTMSLAMTAFIFLSVHVPSALKHYVSGCCSPAGGLALHHLSHLGHIVE